MGQSLKTIKLYGDMGQKFGKKFRLAVKTPAEAIHALCVTRPGFRKYLQERLDAPFRVMVGEEAQGEKGLRAPVGRAEVIKIIPVVSGAKDGWGQILLGAALVALDVGLLHTGYLTNMGMAMVLGGVAQLLAPTPSATMNPDGTDRDLDTFTFSNPTLTTGQGGCVPWGFGEGMIGGHVISAGIDAQTWMVGGFDKAVCLTDDGTIYGNGDTVPWMAAIAP